MSRSKKSRKPGGAPTAKPKLSQKELATVEKRVRKHTGKKSGNRQQEAQPITDSKQNVSAKDPRLGSKKPIVLVKETTKKPIKKKKTSPPITPVKVVELLDETTLIAEINAIEQDDRILAIVAMQEQELELTEQDVDYFNEKMARHQEICSLLGYEDEIEDDITVSTTSSEEDLWDKLDNNDLSKF